MICLPFCTPVRIDQKDRWLRSIQGPKLFPSYRPAFLEVIGVLWIQLMDWGGESGRFPWASPGRVTCLLTFHWPLLRHMFKGGWKNESSYVFRKNADMVSFTSVSQCVPNILFSSVQLLTRVQLFVTPWTVARQSSLSITNSLGTCDCILHRVDVLPAITVSGRK